LVWWGPCQTTDDESAEERGDCRLGAAGWRLLWPMKPLIGDNRNNRWWVYKNIELYNYQSCGALNEEVHHDTQVSEHCSWFIGMSLRPGKTNSTCTCNVAQTCLSSDILEIIVVIGVYGSDLSVLQKLQINFVIPF
jgi:hypothetical protein